MRFFFFVYSVSVHWLSTVQYSTVVTDYYDYDDFLWITALYR